MSAIKLVEHETKKSRVSNERVHIGGLGRKEPVITHYITTDGRLHILKTFNKEVHLAVEGGVNSQGIKSAYMTTDQLNCLTNCIKLLNSIDTLIIDTDELEKFNFKQWIKAIL